MTSDGPQPHDGKRINESKSRYIENYIWIAYNVTILKNATIEGDFVIGINSTVTKIYQQAQLLYVIQ